MILAQKNKWFEKLFARYNEYYLLRRHFYTLATRGQLEISIPDRPMIYVMNHSSWWDGLLVFHAARLAGHRQHYYMMDEKQLSHYRFFRKLGAFSMDKGSLRGMLQSLQYTVHLLENGNSVWIYPQGDIYHLEKRPLHFQSGIGYLLERCPHAAVQPVTAYYTMGNNQKAEATLWFGEPAQGDWAAYGRKGIAVNLQELLERQLDEHRLLAIAAIDGKLKGFNPLLRGSLSTNEAFDAFKRRAARWFPFSGR